MGKFTRKGLILALPFALLSLGCGDETGDDAGAPDTGLTDGGSDAGFDSGPGTDDAGDDAGPPDAGPPDAGPPPPETPAAAGDLVITEIHHSPAGYADDSLAEWLEIYNPSTDTTYNLNGCAFADREARIPDPTANHIIASDVIVAPGAYVTIASNGDAATIGFTVDYTHNDAFGLSGGGEDPGFACGGVVIDVVDYGAAGFLGPADGPAIQLDPGSLDGTANDDGNNWCRATMVYHTEAGLDNLGTPGAPNEACPAPSTPATAGDIVITEIHRSPVGYPASVEPEWIELYNPSDVTIFNLNTCLMADQSSDLFSGAGEHMIAMDVMVARGGYVVIAWSGDPAMLGFTPDYDSMDMIGGLSGTADDPGLGCGATIIDHVDYDTVTGFPATTDGPAIQLSSAALTAVDNDTGSNWCLATSVFFTVGGLDNLGTPGTANAVCP